MVRPEHAQAYSGANLQQICTCGRAPLCALCAYVHNYLSRRGLCFYSSVTRRVRMQARVFFYSHAKQEKRENVYRASQFKRNHGAYRGYTLYIQGPANNSCCLTFIRAWAGRRASSLLAHMPQKFVLRLNRLTRYVYVHTCTVYG